MKLYPTFVTAALFTLTGPLPLFAIDHGNPQSLTASSDAPTGPVHLPGESRSADDGNIVASPAPIDAEATLRAIELKVALQQYEKVLSALEDGKLRQEANLVKGREAAKTGAQSPSDESAMLEVLEQRTKELRGEVTRLIGDGTRAAMEKAEAKVLQGVWRGSETGRESEVVCSLRIAGERIDFRGANKNEHFKGEFLLSPESEPKQMRIIVRDGAKRDSEQPWALALYKIDNGTLTLAFAEHPPGGEKAPASFDPDATTRTFVFRKTDCFPAADHP